MIRLDGYYKLNSVQYKDSIANYSMNGYYHHAYLFLENNTYVKASKIDQNPDVIFSIEDFNQNFTNRYLIQNDQLVITHHTGEEWEFSEIFDKINENVYKNEKQKLEFTNWSVGLY